MADARVTQQRNWSKMVAGKREILAMEVNLDRIVMEQHRSINNRESRISRSIAARSRESTPFLAIVPPKVFFSDDIRCPLGLFRQETQAVEKDDQRSPCHHTIIRIGPILFRRSVFSSIRLWETT